MTLARQHDDMLKEARQDLFRMETQLRVERGWRWPIRAACVALGMLGLAAWQNDSLRSQAAAFLGDVFGQMRSSGVETLISFLIVALVIVGLGYLVRRWLTGPTAEQKARKLMEQFARADGVAAYVFSSQDSIEDEASTVGALTRPRNKLNRRRRLTSSNRLLTTSLNRMLNLPFETEEERRMRQLIEGETPAPAGRSA